VKCGNRAIEAELLRGIGVSQRHLGHFSEAIEADEKSVAIYRELNQKTQVAEGLNNLATNYRLTGDLRHAGDLWEEALGILPDSPDYANFVANNLALIAGDLGNRDAARAYLEQTVTFAEKQKDPHGIAVGLANLGPVYRDLRQYDQALDVYKRALALAIPTHDITLESAVLINRAATYVSMNQRSLAIQDLEESLRLTENVESKDARAIALSNLAPLELASGQPDVAFDHAQEAVALFDQYREPQEQWPAFDALGKCWLVKNDRVQARSFFEKAIGSIEQLRSHSGGAEAGLG
jgi:tetratricopeptide (TPR) repeat protein